MNILKNMNALFTGPSCEYITRYVNDFWKLAGELRADLGENGYYLDQYLSKIFEVLSRLDLGTASEMANNMCWSVQGDCYILCGTEEKKDKSEFFDLVEDYINKHSTKFSDRHAKVQFYTGNILIEHLNIFTEKVKLIYRKNVLSEIDYPVSDDMYEKIPGIIGERRMERLNDQICEAFVFGPIMMSAAQQIVSQGIIMLCHRDPESSKLIYQLMLEEYSNG